ncbi:hypothetical protein [Cycloclasticus zancles]|uniref:Lipoprotein n=1 Tax=Cycloclasticus zancles 78-ME TaxID=1198232 RepID=S5T7B6_9GAMM|nr:hypothetical protein [Cycloclasticus zancles]AGS39459.1 hypothetical protein CYCME_1128 [Cycloclasticus zancles 78-ME]
MRISLLLLIFCISSKAYSDYGVPFIFQNCHPELDYASFEFDYVNNPENIFKEGSRELRDEVKASLLRKGVIFPEIIESSECSLKGANIRVWTEGKNFLSVSINGKVYIDNIDLNHRGFSFEKFTIDGDQYPSGSESGFMKLCYYEKTKDSFMKQMFSITSKYPSENILNFKSLRENTEKKDRNNSSAPKTCSLFDRF